MLQAGKTAAEIAAELNRTCSSIYSRLQRFYRRRPIRDITGGGGRRRRNDEEVKQ